MNEDVNYRRRHGTSSSLFSRIRTFNHHAFNSIGSFFNQLDNPNIYSDEQDSDIIAPQLFSSDYSPEIGPLHTPTPSRPVTPHSHNRGISKRIFSFGGSGRNQRYIDNSYSNHHCFSAMESPNQVEIPLAQLGIKPFASDGNDTTPPLSPDASSTSSWTSFQDFDNPYGDPGFRRNPARASEIREGKRPQKDASIPVDLDIHHDSNDQAMQANTEIAEDTGDDSEWYGLEYTLELSAQERERDRRASYEPESVGEFSKSRESYTILHPQHPLCHARTETYSQWKNWHSYLDHQKGIEFKSLSKDLAWLYLAEVRLRDVYYWQLENYGVVGYDIEEQLDLVVQHRPDPYFPPQKHNLGWYLKRSRSLASLRELVQSESKFP